MTPELIGRVDTWIDLYIQDDNHSHLNKSPLFWLAQEWNDTRSELLKPVGDLPEPWRPAIKAAMLGILLSIVREVWGEFCHVVPDNDTGGWVLKGASLRGMSVQMQPQATEVEALVVALENRLD